MFSHHGDRRLGSTCAPAVLLLCGLVAACGSGDESSESAESSGSSGGEAVDPEAVRAFIGMQVGGIENLMVPADDAIPVPPDDPERPGRYKLTPAKAFLGKMLFHDPVRTVRVNKNVGQPLDFPAGTAFGGTLDATNPAIDSLVAATEPAGKVVLSVLPEASVPEESLRTLERLDWDVDVLMPRLSRRRSDRDLHQAPPPGMPGPPLPRQPQESRTHQMSQRPRRWT